MGYNKETGLYEGWIYLIVNDINDKVYIGQTRQTINHRFYQHVANGNRVNCTSMIDRVIHKYGSEHFFISELEFIARKELSELCILLDEKEVYYIDLYDAFNSYHYNHTSGGRVNYTSIGSEVDQYDLDGNFIASYSTARLAAHKHGLSDGSQIIACCNGVALTSGGYVWRHKGDSFNKYRIQSEREISVDVYDLNGILLDTFSSMTEASETLHCPLSSVWSCCIGRYYCCLNKYVFRCHGDSFNKYPTFYTDKKAVVEYDYMKRVVNQFESQTAAANYHHTTPITISGACRGQIYTLHGHVFRYVDDDFDKYPVKFRQIWQFDENKHFIKEYPNQSIASRETGIGLSNIQQCCAGKREMTCGYYFKPIGVCP